jgi:GNAT superfamily N-acetyltransferase
VNPVRLFILPEPGTRRWPAALARACLGQIGLCGMPVFPSPYLPMNLRAWKNVFRKMPRITQALSAGEVNLARGLFREYADSLGVDLHFQNFDRELSELPGGYAPPRGRLFLARHFITNNDEQLAGGGALRPLSAETCEMKRLYVRPQFRGLGIGRALADTLIAAARQIGYHAMRLDTLPAMHEAHALYLAMGFQEIAPYTNNPIHGTRFLELDLTRARANEPTPESQLRKHFDLKKEIK